MIHGKLYRDKDLTDFHALSFLRYVETSQLNCFVNKKTGFYTKRESVTGGVITNVTGIFVFSYFFKKELPLLYILL